MSCQGSSLGSNTYILGVTMGVRHNIAGDNLGVMQNIATSNKASSKQCSCAAQDSKDIDMLLPLLVLLTSVFMLSAGIIPECSIVCYFGSLSEGITQIASGKAGPSGVVTYVLVGVTIFFMLAAVTWSTFVVRYESYVMLVMLAAVM